MDISRDENMGASNCINYYPKIKYPTCELVSIITPCYNSSRFLFQSIESVLAQTYQNWEMIIIDDGSTDNSVEIIENFIDSDIRIKLIKSKRRGSIANARNKAIEMASGRYISFLDSDDMWLPKKLEKQIDFMRENEVALSYSSYYLIDTEGNTKGIFIPKDAATYKDLLKTCCIGNLTATYDVDIIGKRYMKNVGHEDYALWLNILKEIDMAKGLREPLAKHRIHNKSASSNKAKAACWQWNIYRNIERLGLLDCIYYFMHYAYYGINKYKVHI